MEHIASIDALRSCTDSLLSTAATLDDAALGRLGEDLAAVAGVLHDQPALRRVLTEATTPVQVRAGLVDRLLSGKISAPALKTVDGAARAHWASGADLRDGIGRLGRTATFLRAERTGELDEVEDQLFRFGRIVDGTPALSVVLDDPAAPDPARVALVRRLLDGRGHPLTIDLLTALARDPGGRSFSHGVWELVEQAAQRRDKLVAVVESPLPLDADATGRLTAALGRVYSRQVAVHVLVNPALVGGLRVRVGDEVIDGSVSGRLDDLRSRLAG